MKSYLLPGILAVIFGAALYVALRPAPLLLEIGPAAVGPIREFVGEEARTRLPHEYLIAMPEHGDLLRIPLMVGDRVEAGDVVARLDDFAVQRELAGIEALIAQAAAQVAGVDVQKPKPEDLESTAVRVREAEHATAIARRELEIAAARLEQAARERERARALLEQGILSPADHEAAETLHRTAAQQHAAAVQAVQLRESETQLARLAERRLGGSIDDNEYLRLAHEAEIARLETQREILLHKIERTLLRAPVGGVVLDKYEESARALPAGAPLMRLGDPAHLEIECDVLSDEIGAIRAGNPVELIGAGIPFEHARGAVRQVYPAAFTKRSSLGIEQQRVRVIVEFDNSGIGLVPGARLDLRIVTARKDAALIVPDRAVFREGGQHYVFRVIDGRAERVPVRVGLRNDSDAEILDGLAAGDLVVHEPTTALAEGMRVEALP